MSKVIKNTSILAKHFNVSRGTIYNWIEKGMPYLTLGNGRKAYNLEEVENWYFNKK